MPRRWRLAILVGLATVLAVWWQLVQPQRPWIGTVEYGHIENGMTRRQVEADIGPPGDYRSGPTEIGLGVSDDLVMYDHGPKVTISEWAGDRWILVVIYDENGQVIRKFIRDNDLVKQAPIENLIWRTKRLWREWFP